MVNHKIGRKAFIIISFFMMAIILGLRGDGVGEDTRHFLAMFEQAKSISWKKIFTSGFDIVYATIWNVDLKVESGYVFLNKLVGIFTSNGQWILIIVAFMTCGFMGRFVYHNFSKPFWPTYIFFCESLYMNSFNLMRQMLAISIGLQSYEFLKRRNYAKAIGIILFAFLVPKARPSMSTGYSSMYWRITFSTGSAALCGKKMSKNLIDTVRLKLLKIAVKVIHSGRYIKFKLCSRCPYKEEVFETLRNIWELAVQLE